MLFFGLIVLLLLGACEAAAADAPVFFGPRLEDVLDRAHVLPNANLTSSMVPRVLASREELSVPRVAHHLRALRPDRSLSIRGEREMRVYAGAAPAVVLIIANDGIGSGSLVTQDGAILTNWHVLGDRREVAIVFKPIVEGQTVSRADVYRGRVLRVDEIADLALIKAESVPPHARVLPIGTMERVRVGADVHAIGHPTGESWTYTKGIISQIRRGYEWTVGSGKTHRADVIQTQTPINPGNSGGPLLSDDGQLVGVNSFKAKGEGLNFAVSVDEVRRFLTATVDRRLDADGARVGPSPTQGGCEPREVARGRNGTGDAVLVTYDFDCDGGADAVLTVPDDPGKAITLFVEGKNADLPNILFVDRDRDGKWDVSLYDIDRDGKPELIGYHRNGEERPYRLEPFVASR